MHYVVRGLQSAVLAALIGGAGCHQATQQRIVVIENEKDLDSAMGKEVMLRAKLFSSKLPVLKIGNTVVYCWAQTERDGRKGTARDLLLKSGVKRFSKKGIDVKVWGKLSRYKPVEGDQLYPNPQIHYYRMEIDNERTAEPGSAKGDIVN